MDPRPNLEAVRAAFARLAPDGAARERRQQERRAAELAAKRGNPRKANRQAQGESRFHVER